MANWLWPRQGCRSTVSTDMLRTGGRLRKMFAPKSDPPSVRMKSHAVRPRATKWSLPTIIKFHH